MAINLSAGQQARVLGYAKSEVILVWKARTYRAIGRHAQTNRDYRILAGAKALEILASPRP